MNQSLLNDKQEYNNGMDMLIEKEKFHGVPPLNKETQEINDCLEEETQSFPGMNPILIVQFRLVSLETLYIPTTTTEWTQQDAT